ncbi:MAG: phytanoyl-CoA dioxygenase family protein [Planctomycetota bacterium]|nr:phytanoyl-CoA dioxygenase family protein [Planctomycetota bacterium]MDA1139826.1 phytanoyl-CoA dioxygenase family protein [Planctomycetota bacterium]
MKISFGNKDLEFPGPLLGELRASNELMGDAAALHARMEEDGYLLIRGLHDREKVLAARRVVFEYAEANGTDPFKPGTDLMDAVYNEGGRTALRTGLQAVTHQPEVLAILEGGPIFDFFNTYFGCPTGTFDWKWMRCVSPGGQSSPHYDFVYMGRGSRRLLTCWTPMGDITPDMGTLTLLHGSHNLDSFKRIRETYGETDVDTDGTPGSFSNNPLEVSEEFGGRWLTSKFEAGDVLIFTMHTMHASTKNISDRWRLSFDTRYQPVEDPMDERWVGKNPIAHDGSKNTRSLNIEEARKEWGLQK